MIQMTREEAEQSAQRQDELQLALKITLEALKVITPKELQDGWWCPECQTTIDVATYNECCTECGTYLTDVQPSAEWHKQALDAISQAEAKL